MIQNRLVRDKIEQLKQVDGENPITRTLTPVEFSEEIKRKLLEEAAEAATCHVEDLAEELADVIEVVYAIAGSIGLTLDELEHKRLHKLGRKGGFTTRTYLISTDPEAK